MNSVIYPNKHSNNHLKTEGNYDSITSVVDKPVNNHLKTEGNYDSMTSVVDKPVDRSRIKRKSSIFYMKHNPEEDLETEYQRSYSNKKLPLPNEQHQDIMRSSKVLENDVKTNNYHNSYKHKHSEDLKVHIDT